MNKMSKIIIVIFSLSFLASAEAPDYGPYGPKAVRYGWFLSRLRENRLAPPPAESDLSAAGTKSLAQECVEKNDKVCLIDLYPVTEKDIELATSINVLGEPRVHPNEEDETGITVCVDKAESIDQKLPSLSLLSGKLDALPGQLTTLESLSKGQPASIALSRKPITLLIDLPGALAGGKIRVEDPNNGSEIYAAIDNALSSFFDRIEEAAREEGGTVPGNVGGYTITHVENSNDTLAKIQLGFNAQDKISGMRGKVDINATTKTVTRVLYTKFQQVLFQVVADSVPVEQLFADTVTAAQLYRVLRDTQTDRCVPGSGGEAQEKINTLGMHKSAKFGRVMLLKTTFRNVATSVDLNAVMNYALAGKSADADLNSEYQNMLKEAEFSLTVVGSTQVPIIQDHTKLIEKINETMALSRSSPPALIEVSTVAVQNGRAAKVTYSGDVVTTTCTRYQSGWIDFRNRDWQLKTQQIVEWNLKDLKTGKLMLDAEGEPILKRYKETLSGSGKGRAANLPANAVNVYVQILNCGLGSCNTVIWENMFPGPPNICVEMENYGVFKGRVPIKGGVRPGRCI